MKTKHIVRLAAMSLVMASMTLALLVPGLQKAQAEGTYQVNEQQGLESYTELYADILNAGETLNISSCENTLINIWDTNDTLDDTGDDSQVVTDAELTANLNCGNPLPNPITGAYEFTPENTGTFRFALDSDSGTIMRYDFTVTPNNSTDPDPTIAGGRIWSYQWYFSADSPELEQSTDVDLYALVPAPAEGESFVWKLDLNKFAGNVYELSANSTGLDAPYAGLSASGNDASVTPEYPIYLGYPDIAGDPNSTTPLITNLAFLDDAEEDDTFSPGGTEGEQDTGTFNFTSNVDNATYAITIDTNKDGKYGTGDRLLLGNATLGANSVTWDGTYPNGDPVAEGAYNARVQIRIGEFHFVADDVESSGGTTDGGETWINGLTIYKALDASTTENTTVYWDDLTELSDYEDATSNVPGGVTSGSTVDADGDGRADGFHTWGNFTGDSMGDGNMIDTYVYGASDTKFVSMGVAPVDGTDSDGVSSSVEYLAPNNGDGNGDGTADHLQDNVTSLPNPVTDSAYNTIAVENCNGLADVEIFAESDLSDNDSDYDYPVGLFNFQINCGTPGATATVKIYYDKAYDTSTWLARKFVNGQYGNIDGATFGTATVGGTTVTTLTYSITDGGPLDEDGLANGVIVDPVGPGTNGSLPIVGAPDTGLQRANLTTPFIMVTTGLLLAYAVWQSRKEFPAA